MKSTRIKTRLAHPLSKLILNILIDTTMYTEASFAFHSVDIKEIDKIVIKELQKGLTCKELRFIPRIEIGTRVCFEHYIRQLTYTLNKYDINKQ